MSRPFYILAEAASPFWKRVSRCFRVVGPGVIVSCLAAIASAQTSQFIFDGNGNLSARVAESVLPPQIIGQPQNQIVGTNQSASFSVVVADPRSLTYQWRFNNANVGGETNAALFLETVSVGSEGTYRVVLTNPSGSVTSAPAMLWIDNDGDNMGDSWELDYFSTLTNNATSDSDNDGLSNVREFIDGTHPANPNSARYKLLVIREGGVVIISPEEASYNKGQPVMLTAVPGSNELFHAWLGDVITRDNPVTLVMTNDKTVFARYTPITFQWTNVTSGNWETATNWTPNLVPGLNDRVVINNNVTVTLNTNADCADVTLGGTSTTLTGSGTLGVRGNLFWDAGTMSGSGRTILESNTLASIQNLALLNGRTLENHGTILWSGAENFGVIGGAIITNGPGGLFRAENGLPALLGGGIANGRFDNGGTFRKAGSSETLTIASGLNFNNTGTVETQGGLLIWDSSFTNNGSVISLSGTTNRVRGGGSGNGSFNAAAMSVVEWTSGTFTLNSGARLDGAGIYRISATATVAADANFAVANLDLIAGTLAGSGIVTISNAMNWTGGTLSGGGRTFIAAGVTLNLASVSGVGLSTRTLENAGTVLWTGPGVLGMNFGGIITNRPGALFHAQNAATLNSGAGPNRFDNAGTFRKSTDGGTTTIGSIFNNSGTLEVQVGTLLHTGVLTNNGAINLSPGTTNRVNGGGSASGTFNAPPTSVVEWTGGTFTLNPGAQLSGAGLYRINGISATVIGNGDVTVQNLDLLNANSTWDGTGVLTISSAMNWTAGTMAGSGRTFISPVATLQLGGASFASLQRVLENGGTTTWSGAGPIILLNGIITNRAGGLFQAQNSAAFSLAGGGCRFDNAGTFRKTTSAGTTTVPSGVPFNNNGTVDLRSGFLAANGGYVSSSNALLNCALSGTTAGTNYGQLQVSGAVTLNGALSVDFTNGFSPALNDSFTVLTTGTRNGAFGSFFYPSNAVTLQLSNAPNSVIVRVTGLSTNIPQPALLLPELSGNNFKLTWTAVSNTTYRVEFAPNLTPASWTILPGDVIAISNTATKFDALTSSNRFYRIRVVP